MLLDSASQSQSQRDTAAGKGRGAAHRPAAISTVHACMPASLPLPACLLLLLLLLLLLGAVRCLYARTTSTHDSSSLPTHVAPSAAPQPSTPIRRGPKRTEVWPAPATGHDTWPANLLHPSIPPVPCCRPLHLSEASSGGRNNSSVCTRQGSWLLSALSQAVAALTTPAICRPAQFHFHPVYHCTRTLVANRLARKPDANEFPPLLPPRLCVRLSARRPRMRRVSAISV